MISEETWQNKLSEWPQSFTRLTNPELRRELLHRAIAAGLEPADSYRTTLLSLRYDKSGKDSFMYTWLMLRGESDASHVFKGLARKKLLQYAKALLVDQYAELTSSDQAILWAEWRHIGVLYIYSCVNAKSYGAFLNLIPLKRDTRAAKILANIEQAAKNYPSQLGCDSLYYPFYHALVDAYEEAISLE